MFVLWCLFVFVSNEIQFGVSDTTSVFGRIQNGLKLAGKLLGLDKATEVAQLVTETFGKPARKGENLEGGISIFSKFLKLLGLESKKLSAIAVNAIVFLAQLISTTLSRPPPAILTHGRSLRPGTPMDWILNNPNSKIKELLKLAKDPQLPDKLLEYLKERTSDDETGCVQLLICKTSPFLWGMQRALADKTTSKLKANGVTGMLKYLPTADDVRAFGDECESKFPECILY